MAILYTNSMLLTPHQAFVLLDTLWLDPRSHFNVFESIFVFLSSSQRMSGGEFVGFNNAVFLSERENADRNYALAFYMRENKCFPEKINLRECLDFYFQVSFFGF